MTRQQLAERAAAVMQAHTLRGDLYTGTVRHDDGCPILRGKRVCAKCDPVLELHHWASGALIDVVHLLDPKERP